MSMSHKAEQVETTFGTITGQPPVLQGWKCPSCGAGVAPHVKVCPVCAPHEVYVAPNGTYSSTNTAEGPLPKGTSTTW